MEGRTLTKEQAIEQHRKMWKWIAVETMKRKRVVTKRVYFMEHNLKRIRSLCWCCEYAEQKTYHRGMISCSVCPINFKAKYSHVCCDDGSAYKDFLEAIEEFEEIGYYKKIAYLAYKIAKLPER